MVKNTIKIFLVDDHDIVRDGINALLMLEDDIEVIGEASNANELNTLLKSSKPDLILLDIIMPGESGIEIAEKMNIDYPDVKIIILSSDLDENSIFNAIYAGINGYLPKNVKKTELLEAIRQVDIGKEYYSDAISTTIFKNYKKFAQKGKKQILEHTKTITPREKEIVRCFAEGLSYKEIAEKLFITISTVESHKNNIMQKLELKTTVDLVKYAIRNGIIEL
jgi:DNA-binding NarL/FixJ family response regulator